MPNLLFTQCLQNDFVKPLDRGEALPNLLHIGFEESQRLLGDNPSDGPIAKVMNWANAQSRDDIEVIHIRDWHDDNAKKQIRHLEQFGVHCVANSAGAEFVYELVDAENHQIINSTTLNDFEDTELNSVLEALDTDNLRIGIMGVWTEAKILFLAYELTTRFPEAEVAVCSALTASSSRSQHFLALQQLQNIVGVKVADSIGEFVQFLGSDETLSLPLSFNEHLDIKYQDDRFVIGEQDRQLIQYLFRDCREVTLKILDGGFSGNLVAGSQSFDQHGREQAAHVIKIGPRHEMAKERTSFEQIEPVLGNNAPAIADFADLEERSAIKYRYASMDGGKTRCMQEIYMSGASLAQIKSYLNAVYNVQLGRLYRAANNDNKNLLEYYCFDSQWADSVKNKIEELIGPTAEKGLISLPGGVQVYNLYEFYREDLDRLPALIADFPFSFIHGDLNGANIMIDKQQNVWIIDFFHTHCGHVLKDFAKLENDLLYIYTPIETKDDLIQAYAFTDFLLSFEDPLANDTTLPTQFIGTPFERAFATLIEIRRHAGTHLEDNHAHRRLQWLVPQMRYAVHTIGFDEPTQLQMTWALYTSCQLAELVVEELENLDS